MFSQKQLNIFVVCLLALTSGSTPNPTSVATFSEEQGVNLAKLLALSETFQRLSLEAPSGPAFLALVAGYEQLLDHQNVSATIPDNTDIIANIRQATTAIISSLTWSEIDVNHLEQKSVDLNFVRTYTPPPFSREIFQSRRVVKSEWLEIRTSCIVSDVVRAAFVVYPTNTSPFHPPPVVDFPITRFKVFDLVLARAAGDADVDGGGGACPNNLFFDVVTLRWTASNAAVSARTGCAQRSPYDAVWTTDRCSLFTKFTDPRVVACFCDTKANRELTEYVVYEYEEDTTESFEFVSKAGRATNGSDAREMQVYRDAISAMATNPVEETSFGIFVSDLLPAILSFDAALLLTCENSSLLEDIGVIMKNAAPHDDASMIGRGNDRVHAFLFLPMNYRRRPPVAFAFHTNHTKWLAYQRAGEELDPNRIFARHVEFSVVFPDSATAQCERYGFVLHPVDAFFATIAVPGRRLLASRVVDVFAAAYDTTRGVATLAVHVYFNPWGNSTQYGCARRTATSDGWTTDGCAEDPDVYRGVCTCVVDVAAGRSQIAAYRYQDADFFNLSGPDFADFFYMEYSILAVFAMRMLKHYPPSVRVGNKAFEALTNVRLDSIEAFKLVAPAYERLLSDVRDLLTRNGCDNALHQANTMYMGVVCVTPDDKAVVAASFNDGQFSPTTFAAGEPYISNATGFGVRVSSSVPARNARYALLAHSNLVNWRPAPSLGRALFSSRLFDVVLVPRDGDASTTVQSVEFYIANARAHAALGCAFWDADVGDWSTLGCHVVAWEARETCNCSVAGTSARPRGGGQYVAYLFATVCLDEAELARFGVDSVDDGARTLARARAIVGNMSRLPIVDGVFVPVVRVLQVYARVLGVDADTLVALRGDTLALVADVERVVWDYFVSGYAMTMSLGIRGAWTVKSAEVTRDLFSNAVLSTDATADVATASDMSLLVLSDSGTEPMFDVQLRMPTGFYLSLVDQSEVSTITYGREVPVDPIFACTKVRGVTFFDILVFVVYPNNKSPFPMDMTTAAIFNARQMDVYFFGAERDLGEVPVMDVSYRPTSAPKSYVRVGCATRNDDATAWHDDVCVLNATSKLPYCRCDFARRRVTRVVVYEYTDEPNFALVSRVDGPLGVFLVGASLSFFGLSAIAATALVFPAWRDDICHKILMQLSASALLYLALATFRETHTIYAAPNADSVGLAVFTASVHYTRLVHYCWGLVMSVLQYKKFSSIAGAATQSHLLLKVAAFAWGAPLAPLVVMVSWKWKVHFCSPDKLAHLVLYLVPCAVITAINIALMAGIIYHITDKCGRGLDKDLQRHGVNEKDLLKRRLKIVVLIFFLFGISVLFEMCNDIDGHILAIEYLFKIFDPVLGFVMFMYFIVMDKRTCKMWKTRLCG